MEHPKPFLVEPHLLKYQLPYGWIKECHQRKGGQSAGQWDTYYFYNGIRFRSMKEIQKFLDSNPNVFIDEKLMTFIRFKETLDSKPIVKRKTKKSTQILGSKPIVQRKSKKKLPRKSLRKSKIPRKGQNSYNVDIFYMRAPAKGRKVPQKILGRVVRNPCKLEFSMKDHIIEMIPGGNRKKIHENKVEDVVKRLKEINLQKSREIPTTSAENSKQTANFDKMSLNFDHNYQKRKKKTMTKEFQCKVCLTKFKSSIKLKKHSQDPNTCVDLMTEKNLKNIIAVEIPIEKEKKEKKKIQKDYFQCSRCGFQDDTRNKLIDHFHLKHFSWYSSVNPFSVSLKVPNQAPETDEVPMIVPNDEFTNDDDEISRQNNASSSKITNLKEKSELVESHEKIAEINNTTHETFIGEEIGKDFDDEPSKITSKQKEKSKTTVDFHEKTANINTSTNTPETSITGGEMNEKEGKNISKCQYLLTNGKICSATFPMKPNFIREESEITAWYNIGHPRYHQNELPCGCIFCQLGKYLI